MDDLIEQLDTLHMEKYTFIDIPFTFLIAGPMMYEDYLRRICKDSTDIIKTELPGGVEQYDMPAWKYIITIYPEPLVSQCGRNYTFEEY